MKKKYEKPQVYMEKFELAEHIAGCKLTLQQDDVNICEAYRYYRQCYVTYNRQCMVFRKYTSL